MKMMSAPKKRWTLERRFWPTERGWLAAARSTSSSESDDDSSTGTINGTNGDQAPTTEAQSPTQPPLNLQCKKSIDLHFPFMPGKGRYQPPATFCVSAEEVIRFRSFDVAQQKEAKAAWVSLSKKEKKEALNRVPGSPCLCCGRKPRKDIGTTRARTGRRGVAQPPAAQRSTNADVPEDDTVDPFASLTTGDETTREEHTIKPQEKRKRQSIGRWDFAKDTQQCGGEQALFALHRAYEKFGRALTCTTVEPPINDRRQQVYPSSQGAAPRVLGLQVVVNFVRETRNTGAKIPPEELRASKPVITIVSTCAEDANTVLELIDDSIENKDKYDKVTHYGTGEYMKSSLRRHRRARSSRRSRGRTSASSMAESQREIPEAVAPTIAGNDETSQEMPPLDTPAAAGGNGGLFAQV